MMKKDKSILQLIKRLRRSINFASIEVVDYWEADYCAIGLKKDKKLIYISTYNYHENDILKLDYDLELINENEINVVGTRRNVSEAVLVNDIQIFFEVL